MVPKRCSKCTFSILFHPKGPEKPPKPRKNPRCRGALRGRRAVLRESAQGEIREPRDGQPRVEPVGDVVHEGPALRGDADEQLQEEDDAKGVVDHPEHRQGHVVGGPRRF